MSKFGKAVDEQVKYTGLNMFKAFLGGMAFGAMLMGLLLLPSTLNASQDEYDESRYCLAQNIYFESANQLKHLQDIEDNLVEALVLNRKAMNRANEQRLAFMRTTIEPDDLINERKIRLLGLDRQSMMQDENFDQWFGENIVMLKGSNDEL